MDPALCSNEVSAEAVAELAVVADSAEHSILLELAASEAVVAPDTVDGKVAGKSSAGVAVVDMLAADPSYGYTGAADMRCGCMEVVGSTVEAMSMSLEVVVEILGDGSALALVWWSNHPGSKPCPARE